MSQTTTVTFEERVRETLDDCILKMAEHLNNGFEPLKKESMSLFRQFCAALRTRVQWVKNFFAPIEKITTNNNANRKSDTEKSNLENNASPLRTVASFTRDVIDETLKNYPKNTSLLDLGYTPSGLLMKR